MICKLLSTTALMSLSLCAVACSDVAKSNQAAPAPQVASVNAVDRAVQTTENAERGQLLEEAVTALRETQNAVTAIDQKKPNDAIAALERATGKLEIVLARTPDLALAPVDVTTTTFDVLGTVADVESVRAQAKSALDRGRLQEARRLITDLASETVVSVSNLPLATYPAAIKQAAALLHQGKPQDAKAILETALSTIVVDRTIIPLPLVRAQAAVEQARGLSQKANRTAAENARLRALLATARTELRFGQALGYGNEKDMSNLLAAVDEIDRKTSGQQHAPGLLDRIGGLFATAKASSQPHATQ